jgi:hypothetical protein
MRAEITEKEVEIAESNGWNGPFQIVDGKVMAYHDEDPAGHWREVPEQDMMVGHVPTENN